MGDFISARMRACLPIVLEDLFPQGRGCARTSGGRLARGTDLISCIRPGRFPTRAPSHPRMVHSLTQLLCSPWPLFQDSVHRL